MRILIADDEPLVRIGIKSSYEWKEAGMDIVGEAADGEEALRLIAEQKPDVVILDIKMPKKDGIEVLDEMRRQGMMAKVIILSSFDDFMHVKKAMQLGAVDYFHKPSMNVQEIVCVLQRLKAAGGGQREDHDAAAARKPDKETVLRDMLYGMSEHAELTKLKETDLYAVLFAVKEYARVLKRYPAHNAGMLTTTIGNILGELLDKEEETEYIRLEENLFAVFVTNSASNSAQAAFARVNEIVYSIYSTLKRFVNIETVTGISGAFHSFGDMMPAVLQAKQALELKFYHPNDPLFYYRDRNINEERQQEEMGALIAAMKSGLKEEKYDEFARRLTEWEQYVQTHECMTEQEVVKIFDGLLFMMNDGNDYGEEQGRRDDFSDFTECSAYYHALFNDHLKAKLTGIKKEYSPLIRNVIQFIDTHYSENLSLKLLGDTFQASPNYLSRLFKQEVGRGLFDYLSVVRIGKAKELLKDYGYKIYEIAEMVGFKSQVHFAIVFNKYEGMSPKDYRKEFG